MKASRISQVQRLFQQKHLKKNVTVVVLLLLGLLLFTACGGGAEETPEAVVTDPIVAEGQTVFKQNCASCHAVSGDTIIVGPSLAGIASRAATQVEGQDAKAYIQLSILRPGEYVVEGFSDLMPTNFGTTLTGEQLDSVVVYLMTLEE